MRVVSYGRENGSRFINIYLYIHEYKYVGRYLYMYKNWNLVLSNELIEVELPL